MRARISSGGDWLAAGCRLDRYEMLLPMAEGGMARLWLAQQHGKHGFGRVVAIKTILPALAAENGFREMFLDEARVAAGLHHDNIAQVLDLGDEGGILFLVMEWLDGESLVNLSRAISQSGCSLPLGILCRIVADACAGLHAAHELTDADGYALNIIHRDISPHNLFVEFRGLTKVIDFGIAKARNRQARDTNVGVLKGKIAYMAPEQAMGLTVDRRADVWGAGATMYRFLAGRAPYGAPNQMASLRLIVSGEPPAPLRREVPAPVREVVEKAMHLDPAMRFRTADEMRMALEDAMRAMGGCTTRAEVTFFMLEHLGSARAVRTQEIENAVRASRSRADAAAVASNRWADTDAMTPTDSPYPLDDRQAVRDTSPDTDSGSPPASDAPSDTTAPDRGRAITARAHALGPPRFSARKKQPAARALDSDDEFDRRRTLPEARTLAGIFGPQTRKQGAPALVLEAAPKLGAPPLPDGHGRIPKATQERAFRPRPLLAWATGAAGAVALFAVGVTRVGSPGHGPGRAADTPAALARVLGAPTAEPPDPSEPVAPPPASARAEPHRAIPSPALVSPSASASTGILTDVAQLQARARDAMRLHSLTRAQTILESALSQAPTDCETLTLLAEVEEEQGAHPKALADYRHALDSDPSYLPARIGLADTLWSSGDPDGARAVYQAVVDGVPAHLCPERARQRATIAAAGDVAH
jgi:serine/threonine-protein kinase